jgi:cobalt-precorrin-5B (C1)-methyltransferase
MPGGIALTLDVRCHSLRNTTARCAVQKDSGDDPDVTNGVLVYAEVSRIPFDILIEGGEGVGRVTKPGLDQPVGAAAINSVPRRMIQEAAEEACAACGYAGGLWVVISIPEGATLARRTFNPRMGIEGGLSVIGTTGIVEPMSSRALLDTIRLELKQLAASGARDVLLTPGNYGEAFVKEKLELAALGHITCSNFIGDAIDAAIETGFLRILLVGHIGKLIKLGIGAFNTHSSQVDGRMETLIACALEAGAENCLLRDIAGCVSTDAAIDRIAQAGLLRKTMLVFRDRAAGYLSRRVPETVSFGFVCFTNAAGMAGVLAQSDNAEELMNIWRKR